MQKLADVIINKGLQSFKIKRLLAASFIDTGNYDNAIKSLEALSAEIQNSNDDESVKTREFNEVQALLGRVYKQLYTNGTKSGSFNIGFLKRALQFYYNVFVVNPRSFLWHGIML
jgi:hypothetical protein